MRLLEYGPTAWLVELDGGHDDVFAWADAIRAGTVGDDLIDVVPGATTVLVSMRTGVDRRTIAERIEALRPPTRAQREATDVAEGRDVIEIPVVYDGVDLGDVADATGSTTAEVIERHAAATYRCAFCGFAPGFAYLTGLNPSLVLARRETPRTRVPAGSVAIAAEYTAVYPTASPGGWHLIGRTDAPLWDIARRPPAMIEPGALVRFVPLRGDG